MNDQTPASISWYFKTSILILAVLVIGPFALPLLWLNPRYTMLAKVIWTILIIIATYFLTIAMIESIKTILEYYKLAFGPQ
ncbi:MAG: hypothetical protein HZC17_00870 [Candidatus Omnitrophica bacterium]|nr:hypothetical protein [Candidatus Omnitrophota bacterium]